MKIKALVIWLFVGLMAFGQAPVGFEPMAPVQVIRTNGDIKPFGYGASTDLLRGTALRNALSFIAANNYDDCTVELGPGTFNVGANGLDLSDGGTLTIHLVGDGMTSTEIQSQVLANTACILPGDGSTLSDFYINANAGSGFQLPLGVGTGQPQCDNIIVRNVKIRGLSDGFYFVNASSGKIFNCDVETTYDTIRQTAGAASFDVYSSKFYANGPSAEGNEARAVANDGGTWRFYGCDLRAEDGNTTTACVYTGGGTVELYGCKVGSSSGGTPYDLLNAVGTIRIDAATAGTVTASKTLGTITRDFPAATDTYAGTAELATAAETTTGTDAARALTPDGLAGSNYGKSVVTLLVSDPNGSAITTGDGKAFYRIPANLNGFNLVAVAAAVTTASSSGTPTIQVHNLTQTADMLSTRITIDANELDSKDAAAAVIDTGNDDVATGDQIRIDTDTAGTGTKGLIVELTFQLP